MIYARKLNLNPRIKQELFDGARHIQSTVTALDPTVDESDSWGFMDCGTTEWKFFCDYHSYGCSIVIEPMKDIVRYAQLKKSNPEIISYFDRFGLCHMYLHMRHDIEKTLDNNAMEVHRHAYDETSSWNLVLFDKKVEGSIVKFFEVNDPQFSSLPEKNKYYENLPRTVETTQLHELKIHEGDVYAFNVPQWHTFIPKRMKGRYTIHFMHLKGAIDVNTTEIICKRLECLHEN